MNKYIVNKQDAKKKKLGANLLRAVSILAIVAIVIVFFITIPATAETEEAIEAARIKTLTYRYAFSFLVFVILSFFVIIFNEVLGGLYNLLKTHYQISFSKFSFNWWSYCNLSYWFCSSRSSNAD